MYVQIESQEGLSQGRPKTARLSATSENMKVSVLRPDKVSAFWRLVVSAECAESKGNGSRGGMTSKEIYRKLTLELDPSDLDALFAVLEQHGLLKAHINEMAA